jgi:hypothetical protein
MAATAKETFEFMNDSPARSRDHDNTRQLRLAALLFNNNVVFNRDD